MPFALIAFVKSRMGKVGYGRFPSPGRSTASEHACYEWIDYVRIYRPAQYDPDLYLAYEDPSSAVADEAVYALLDLLREDARKARITPAEQRHRFHREAKRRSLPSSVI